MNVKFGELVIGNKIFKDVSFEDMTLEEFMSLTSDARIDTMDNIVAVPPTRQVKSRTDEESVGEVVTGHQQTAVADTENGKRGGFKPARSINVFDLQNKTSADYPSMSAAAAAIGANQSTVSVALREGRLVHNRYQVDFTENCRKTEE